MSEGAKGSNNVFADLGFEHPEQMATRAELTHRVYTIIKERGLKPKATATLLELPLPDAKALLKGKFNDFSIDRLLRMLTRLDQVVTIQIKGKPKKRAHGGIEVLAA